MVNHSNIKSNKATMDTQLSANIDLGGAAIWHSLNLTVSDSNLVANTVGISCGQFGGDFLYTNIQNTTNAQNTTNTWGST